MASRKSSTRQQPATEPAVLAAQTAPVASVVYRITASDLDPDPCLSLFGRPLVIGWRRRGALTYQVHLRTPRLVFFYCSVPASLGEGCSSLVSRPRKGNYTVACRCLGSPLGPVFLPACTTFGIGVDLN